MELDELKLLLNSKGDTGAGEIRCRDPRITRQKRNLFWVS